MKHDWLFLAVPGWLAMIAFAWMYSAGLMSRQTGPLFLQLGGCGLIWGVFVPVAVRRMRRP
jgi:hypothetical protein